MSVYGAGFDAFLSLTVGLLNVYKAVFDDNGVVSKGGFHLIDGILIKGQSAEFFSIHSNDRIGLFCAFLRKQQGRRCDDTDSGKGR